MSDLKGKRNFDEMYALAAQLYPGFSKSWYVIRQGVKWYLKKIYKLKADVAIYLLGLSEILGIDLEDEIQKKVYKNSKREYTVIDGVNTRTKEFNEESER